MNLSEIRILVVDDDPEILNGTARLLEKAGYSVGRAAGGEEALQAVQAHRPDLMLLARHLPGIDGLEVSRRVKHDRATADTIVVIISDSFVESEQRSEEIESDADDYLTRPIPNRELLARLAASARIVMLTRLLNQRAEELKQSQDAAEQAQLASLNLMEDALAARDRTERASQALRSSESQLQVILESTDDGILAVDHQGKILKTNRRFAELWKVPQSILASGDDKAVLDHVLAQVSESVAFLEKVESLYASDATEMDEIYFKDGRCFERFSSPMLEGSAITGRVWSFRDITERKRSEQALLESHERFELANRATFNVLWDWDLRTNSFWRNDNFQKLFGYSKEDVETGFESSTSRIHPDDMESVNTGLEVAIHGTNEFWADQFRFRRKDGSYATVEDRAFITRDADGRATRMLGAMQDISERKQSEALLRESEERHRLLADHASDVIWTMDLEGRFTYVSPSVEKLRGYTAAEVMQQPVEKSLTPGSAEIMKLEFARAIEAIHAGRPFPEFRGELEQTCSGGTTVWTEVTTTGMRNAMGEFIGILGITRDITERRGAEASLRLQSGALEAAANAIVITDDQGVIEWANQAFTAFTGYDVAEAIGKTPGDLINSGKHDAAFYVAMWSTLHSGEAWKGEMVNRRKDGSLYTEDMTITPLKDGLGEITHFVAVKQDITERKQAEVELSNLNRALKMLSACNEALVRTEDERDLLNVICEIAIRIGGYRMAWVGYAQNDVDRSILPMAHAGEEQGYLSEMKVTWSENESSGMGPAGRAIRSGQASLFEDITLDPAAILWMEAMLQRGYRGVLCLPLRQGSHTFGILTLYSGEILNLADNDLELLQEMADDLAFGIGNIRAQLERKQMQQALLKMAQGVSGSASASSSTDFYDLMVTSLVEALGADGGFIGRLPDPDSASLLTVSFIADQKKLENFSYDLAGTPCELVVAGETCLYEQGVQTLFPQDQIAVDFQVQAYAGAPLIDSKGNTLGLLAVFFKTRIENPELVRSTLLVFATRAAGELERQDSDARIREQASLLDKAHDAIMVRDLEHRILFWNKGAERLYGWTPEELVGRSAADLFFDDLTGFQEAQKLLLTEGEWTGNIQQRRKDGNLLMIEAHWTLVRDDQGQPKSVLAINTDITERELVEQHLHQYTERLEAMREIDAALLGARSTAELVQGALTRLRHIVPFERAVVVMFDHGLTEGTILAADQDEPWLPLPGEVMPISHFHDIKDLLAAPFLDLPDLSNITGCVLENLLLSQGLRNLVYIPMESEGAVLGFLALSATTPGILTPMHAEIALDMTDQLVVAIQHTRLKEELEQANQLLESKVEKRTADLRTTVATMQVMEGELRQREAEALAASEAKSTFLAAMSHELRTPLIGVTGMLEVLTQSELDTEQREVVDIIHESSQSLLQIIGNILDFSKIEANKLELALQTFSAPVLMESVSQIFKSSFSSKGLGFFLEVDPKIAPAHVADAMRIRQIMNNFLSNAVKFTESGSVTLRLRLLGSENGRQSLAFEVQDTGIGVSTENMAKLFDPFTQAEASTTRRFGGTGLGLTISRRLAELMGGTLEMQSRLGEGTTITLKLDLVVGNVQDLAKSNLPDLSKAVPTRPTPSIAEAEQERSLVLLAEDHPTNRTVLTQQVNRAGFALEVAMDGQEAYDQWLSGRYAVILTDLHMPRMDGYQLTRAVRDWERANGAPRTPIMALTANAMGGEAERCLDLGMDDFLIKPVTIPQLASKLRQWMPHVKFATVSEILDIRSQEATESFSGVDSKTVLDLCGGDAAAAQEILDDFIAATEADLLAIQDGLREKDKPCVVRQSHRIKGSSAMIGARDLSEKAAKLEAYAKTESAEWEIIQKLVEGIQEGLKALVQSE